MIAGDINHLDAYKKQIPSFLLLCLEAVKDFPFAEKRDGKYDILGCQMSVESPCTEPKEDRKLEGHKKFVDGHAFCVRCMHSHHLFWGEHIPKAYFQRNILYVGSNGMKFRQQFKGIDLMLRWVFKERLHEAFRRDIDLSTGAGR